MNLLRVELTRFFTRRAVVLLLLTGVALAGVMVAAQAFSTRPLNQTELEAAQEALAQQQTLVQPDYQQCLADPEAYFGGLNEGRTCQELLPELSWFLERGQLDLAHELDDGAIALLVLAGALSVVIGATFVGADWASGSLSNQLIFEPRRLRVWTAKAVAVGLGTALGAALAVAVYWTGLLTVSLSRNIDVPRSLWNEVLESAARGVGLAAAAGIGAFALTMLLRHTVGTLGLLFAYVLAGEAVAATLPIDKMTQWSLAHNVFAWFEGGSTVFDASICDKSGCGRTYELSLTHSALYLSALLLISVVVSMAVFRRRDLP